MIASGLVVVRLAAVMAATSGSGAGGPSRLYVNGALGASGNGTSWETAYNNLETALSVARVVGSPVTEIWVAQGVYLPSRRTIPADDRSKTFELPGGVAIHGGFQGNETALTPGHSRARTPSILSGDLAGDDDNTFNNYFNNAYQVCTYTGGANGLESVTLTGFDIRSGNADNTQFFGRDAGGAISATGGTVRFEDGRLYRNLASGAGAAVHAESASIHILNAQIFNNRAGFGGGVALQYFRLADGGSPSATFTNTAFSANHATSDAGAIFSQSHTVTITNCTIALNTAGAQCGGFLNDFGSARVQNSVVFSNSDNAGQNLFSQLTSYKGDTVVTNSCVQDGQALGGSNIAADPRFRSPFESGPDYAGDFHIAVDSPCIDAGDNSADTDISIGGVQPIGPVGIFGIGRIADGDHVGDATVDMGFSEIQYFENVYWRGDGGEGGISQPGSWYGGALPRFFDPLAFELPLESVAFLNQPFAAGLLHVRTGDARFLLGDELTLTYPTSQPFDPSIVVDGDGSMTFEGLPRGKKASPSVYGDVVSVGLNGPGELRVQWPASLSAQQLWVGAGPTPADSGVAFVQDGAEVFLGNLLTVGRSQGELHVSGGSVVEVETDGVIPSGAVIGDDGAGVLRVTDKSAFGTFGDPSGTSIDRFAVGFGSSADVEVAGVGADIDLRARIVNVGEAGAAQLRAVDGGSLTFDAGRVALGSHAGSTGDIRALGGGSVTISTPDFVVGSAGQGILVASGDSSTDITINATSAVFAHHPGSNAFTEIGAIAPGGNDEATVSIDADDIVFSLGGSGTTVLRFDHPTLTTNALNGVQVAADPGSSHFFRLYSGATWNDLSPEPIRFGVGGVASLLMDPGAVINTVSGIEIGPGSSIVGQTSIVGDVLNTGIVDPAVDNAGLPYGGRLVIDGDYTQLRLTGAAASESGALIIRQGGAGPDAHSGLVVNGAANLAGGLFVRFDPGFVPGASSAFKMNVLEADSINGAFDVAFFPGFPDTRYMRLSYNQGARLADGTFGVAAVVTTDILESGVQFPGPQSFPAPGEPNWAALGDVDGDKDLDLIITIPDVDPQMPGAVAVLFNAGLDGMGAWLGFSGSQQFACGASPAAVIAADMDLDLDIDLVVANTGDDDISVYTNDGAGNFTRADYATGGDEPISLCAADFEGGDGLDVAVVHRASRDLVLMVNDGLRVLNPRPPQQMAQGQEPTNVGAGGMDEDKDIDIAVSNIGMNADGRGVAGSGMVSIFLNDGSNALPRLDFGAGDGATSVVVADFDQDGANDVATADKDADTISILLNSGAGGVLNAAVALQVGANPPSLTYADIDGDADPDLAVVASTATDGVEPVVRVLRNNLFNGQLAFAPAANLFEGTQPKFVLAGDVDNDSDPDVISLNNGTLVVTGRGFEPVVVALTALFLTGDANSDGVVDMLDLNIVLSEWTMTGPSLLGDVNHDGVVDFADLNIVLAYYGAGR